VATFWRLVHRLFSEVDFSPPGLSPRRRAMAHASAGSSCFSRVFPLFTLNRRGSRSKHRHAVPDRHPPSFSAESMVFLFPWPPLFFVPPPTPFYRAPSCFPDSLAFPFSHVFGRLSPRLALIRVPGRGDAPCFVPDCFLLDLPLSFFQRAAVWDKFSRVWRWSYAKHCRGYRRSPFPPRPELLIASFFFDVPSLRFPTVLVGWILLLRLVSPLPSPPN